MRYFIDTEFIDDGKTIDLISIGIVSEDGRRFYAQNELCDFGKASEWVRQNVFPGLSGFDIETNQPHRDKDGDTEGEWYTPEGIAYELRMFCDPMQNGKPEFWGYYSAYDHVALCQLFGTMMDLPEGWPMYTKDLRQWADSLGITAPLDTLILISSEHHALADADFNLRAWHFLNNQINR